MKVIHQRGGGGHDVFGAVGIFISVGMALPCVHISRR